MRAICVVVLLATVGFPPVIARAIEIEATVSSEVVPGPEAKELSGLTHAGGDTYYAVSDDSASAYRLTIELNSDGTIAGPVTVDAEIALLDESGNPFAANPDNEGVAFGTSGGESFLFVSNESMPGIRKHSLATATLGHQVGDEISPFAPSATPGLTQYTDTRPNLGFEALARSAGGSVMWTANEEALDGDGPVSTNTTGTAVRLQRMDGSGTPTGQFVYVAEPRRGTITATFPVDLTGREVSGVVDMELLPDGTLLVLERSFGGSDGLGGLPQFHSRIFGVDFAGATDVSGVDDLDTSVLGDLSDESWTPVTKTLLWDRVFATANYEGMTLGPTLAGGDISLLLISDDQGGLGSQDVLALKVTAVPEPSTWMLLLVGGACCLLVVLCAAWRRRSHQRKRLASLRPSAAGLDCPRSAASSIGRNSGPHDRRRGGTGASQSSRRKPAGVSWQYE